jgi:hypothetical protein
MMLAVVDLGGIASIITALAVLTSTFFTLRRVNATHTKVEQIDQAVNGKGPGESTMVSQVQELHDKSFPPPVDQGDAVLPLLRKVYAELTRDQPNGPGTPG